MPLTLNQVLWLIIAIAVVIAIAFLTSFLAQLRRTAKAAELTLLEAKELIKDIKETDQIVKTKIKEAGEVINASKKAAKSLSEVGWFLTTKIIKPKSKYLAILLPLMHLGWRQLRKKKEDNHGK